MSAWQAIDEDLLRRLPLPLGQLYRRAHNAKTPLERHQAAYYLWEAALKLLGSIVVAEFAASPERDPKLSESLGNLARPALGHWWEIVRRFVPHLATRSIERFGSLRDLLFGRARDEFPRAAGLDAALREVLGQGSGARTTVQLGDLFNRLIAYRNRELGHGAAGQRPREFYERMGLALLSGVAEILARVDVLAGRRLVYIPEVRRQPSAGWCVERYELSGEAPRRMESREVSGLEADRLPLPERTYAEVKEASHGEDGVPALLSLHPLLIYDAEEGEVFFLNARRGERRAQYLSYATGRVLEREGLETERREFLASVLGADVGDLELERWEARSQTEEPLERPEETVQRRTIGEFELLARIGRGGMGVVYKAWQPSLGRHVALKCVQGSGDSKIEARFAREIRALGRVEHPNLVKVFTSGSEGDQWFYAMEFIEGADLANVYSRLQGSTASEVSEAEWHRALSSACEDARKRAEPVSSSERRGLPEAEAPAPPPPPAALRAGRGHIEHVVEIVRQVAVAAHTLHEAGVVHRDIKPGNVMLTVDGSHAVLMDLGLAQIAEEEDARLTRTRQFVGTLRYASPEQLLGAGSLDRRSDVYSIGATLWELLALGPLFGAGEDTPAPALMLKIQSAEPGRLRRLNPRVPGDLEAIVLKCLEKDRSRRYATAWELAEDLGRLERGEPVLAQPPTLTYVLGKYVRRHKGRIALAGGLLVLLLAAAALSVYRIDRARRTAEAAAFDLYTALGFKAGDHGDPAQAVLWFANAAQVARDDPERVEANRTRVRSWSRTVPMPLGAFWHGGERVTDFAFHPECTYLLTVSAGKKCRIWRLEDEGLAPLPGGERPVSAAAFSPGGEALVLGYPAGGTEVFAFPGGERTAQLDFGGAVRALAFSRDGHFLALAGDGARVWDSMTGEFATPILEPAGPVRHAVWNARGDRLAIASEDGVVRVFAVPGAAEPLFVLPHRTGTVKPVFVDEDRGLLTSTLRAEATWWDTTTGKITRHVSLGQGLWIHHIEASPSGRLFAVCGNVRCQLWDAVMGRPFDAVEKETDAFVQASFSEDETRIVTAQAEHAATVWAAPGGIPWDPSNRPSVRLSPLVTIRHPNPVDGVKVSPDGRFLATVQRDGLIRVHSMEQRNPLVEVANVGTGFSWSRVDLSHEGKHFLPTGGLVTSSTRKTQVFEVASRRPAGPLLDAGGILTGGALSPDGRHALTLCTLTPRPHERRLEGYKPDNVPGRIQLWDWRTGARVSRAVETESELTDAAFSPDGTRAVVVGTRGQLYFLESPSGHLLSDVVSLPPAPSISYFRAVLGGRTSKLESYAGIEFAVDGSSFVTWWLGGMVQVWDARESKPRLVLGGVERWLDAAFSEDGKYIATGREDGAADVWNAASGRRAAPSLPHPGPLTTVSFSPDGRLLLTAGADRLGRVWNWREGTLACHPLEHEGVVDGVCSVPGHPWVVSSSRDRTARVWDQRSGKPLTPGIPLGDWGYDLKVSPDGRFAFVMSDWQHLIHLHALGLEDEWSPGSLVTFGEIISAQRALEGGGTTSLTSEEWLERWRIFRKAHPEDRGPMFAREAARAWHESQAEASGTWLEWDAARWHLDRVAASGGAVEPERLTRLEEFVRSWRFSKAVEPWTSYDAFVAVDAAKLRAIEESALESRLVKSRGPYVDLILQFSERTGDAVAYAVRTIEADRARKVKVLAGADDSIRIWWNETLVLEDLAIQPPIPDKVSATIELKPGTNTLTVEISQAWSMWGFFLRLEDEDGTKLRLTDDGRLERLEAGK